MSDIAKRLRDGEIHKAAKDLIDRYFGNSDKCLASIPARPDEDADLVLMGGLSEAATAIEARDAEIARLRDAFFWLEAQAKASRTGISFDWVPSVEGESKGWRFMRRHFVSAPSRTLLDAVEAAREALKGHVS